MKIAEVYKKETQELTVKLRRALRKGPVNLAELSSRYDRGVKQIRSLIDGLRAAGLNCEIREDAGTAEIVRDIQPGGIHRIDPKVIRGRRYRFGGVSDTHLGSKYARLDALNYMYDLFEAEGVLDVYHGGNLIDGECWFNRFDLVPGASGLEGQCAIAARDYPHRPHMTTHFIAGDDHEGWYAQREGLNIGKIMQDRFNQSGRTDLHYLSYLEADILIPAPKGKTWIRLMHPGDGSAYATSYAPQKLAESFQGGEKPAALLIGHYHKADMCFPREIFCIQLGCFQDQTPHMRKKKLQAHVGGWIMEIFQAEDGHIARFKQEFIRFYDRGFYTGEKFPRW